VTFIYETVTDYQCSVTISLRGVLINILYNKIVADLWKVDVFHWVCFVFIHQ